MLRACRWISVGDVCQIALPFGGVFLLMDHVQPVGWWQVARLIKNFPCLQHSSRNKFFDALLDFSNRPRGCSRPIPVCVGLPIKNARNGELRWLTILPTTSTLQAKTSKQQTAPAWFQPLIGTAKSSLKPSLPTTRKHQLTKSLL